MKFVGLTDNPEEIKQKYGNPLDWWQRSFIDETEAYMWFRSLLKIYGYKESFTKDGWMFGFTFTPNGKLESR